MIINGIEVSLIVYMLLSIFFLLLGSFLCYRFFGLKKTLLAIFIITILLILMVIAENFRAEEQMVQRRVACPDIVR